MHLLDVMYGLLVLTVSINLLVAHWFVVRDEFVANRLVVRYKGPLVANRFILRDKLTGFMAADWHVI